jgi:hypothetical protein
MSLKKYNWREYDDLVILDFRLHKDDFENGNPWKIITGF